MLLYYGLNWAIRAISLFNTIVLIWLGLTVLLNAERRRWGTWVAAGGLLIGGAFFAAHSSVAGVFFTIFLGQIDFWWRIIWLPFILWPYLWYLVISWYTGVLRAKGHRLWLGVVSVLGCVALALLFFSHTLPSYEEVTELHAGNLFSPGGIPAAMLLYPLYSVACFVLSLSALRHPAGSERFMGNLAQRRALPWLIGGSCVLLAISLCVGGVAIWLLEGLETGQINLMTPAMQRLLTILDILIATLIGAACVLAGQGMVAYEIFTGRAMPRGGLARSWRNCLILAAGFSTVVAASLALTTNQIYPLILATLIMTTFYALLSWRSYAEYERSMERLRPFVASQKLYEHLLTPGVPAEVDIATPFRALCEGVLGAEVAYLVGFGPLAPLGGMVLAYPVSATLAPRTLSGIAARFHTHQDICIPIDPQQYGGAVWAAPLWSERGLTGALLLGHKRDGRIYTQEEMELARATGERLIDTQASAEMARRLMALQRERLAESQIIDQRTRRVLHDDVLAHLHTTMLLLSSPGARTRERPTGARVREPSSRKRPSPQAGDPETTASAVKLLGEIHHQIANLLHAMPVTTTREVARLGLVGALRQVIDTELAAAFDNVAWQIEPEAAQATQQLSSLAAEVIFCAAREAIRNAARYGRSSDKSRPLHLTLSLAWHDGLQLMVEDDGVGLGAAEPATSGSGQGLALHSTMLTIIGGTLTAESGTMGTTRVTLALPMEATAAPLGLEQRPAMPAAEKLLADSARAQDGSAV